MEGAHNRTDFFKKIEIKRIGGKVDIRRLARTMIKTYLVFSMGMLQLPMPGFAAPTGGEVAAGAAE
jgi:hypothetical protein